MKMRTNTTVIIGAWLAMQALILPGRALCVDDAEGWERSAISRNDNAMALEQEAAALLESAASYREREYLYEAERRGNLARAGEAELRAGALEMAAAIHYEKAADNWSHAADVYGTLKDADQQENAEALAGSARESARLALTQAIGSFESAEEAFSESNGADGQKQKAAGEKAEEARNRLSVML